MRGERNAKRMGGGRVTPCLWCSWYRTPSSIPPARLLLHIMTVKNLIFSFVSFPSFRSVVHTDTLSCARYDDADWIPETPLLHVVLNFFFFALSLSLLVGPWLRVEWPNWMRITERVHAASIDRLTRSPFLVVFALKSFELKRSRRSIVISSKKGKTQKNKSPKPFVVFVVVVVVSRVVFNSGISCERFSRSFVLMDWWFFFPSLSLFLLSYGHDRFP